MNSHYSKIREKIDQWKKANDEYHFVDFQDYLLVAFSDEDSIYLNQTDKVESEKFVIFILKFKRPFETINRVWYNVRFKVFYFIKHEYGDFYELDYIPLTNGWKLHLSTTRIDYQSCLDFITLSSIDEVKPDVNEDFKWDHLDVQINDNIIKQVENAFTNILTKSKRI